MFGPYGAVIDGEARIDASMYSNPHCGSRQSLAILVDHDSPEHPCVLQDETREVAPLVASNARQVAYGIGDDFGNSQRDRALAHFVGCTDAFEAPRSHHGGTRDRLTQLVDDDQPPCDGRQ